MFHQPPTLVSRRKLVVLRHVGLLLPSGLVAHCTPTRGEHVSTIEEFAAGQDVRIDREVPPEQHAPTLQRVARAIAAPRTYNLVTNNCEVFAKRLAGDRPESPQFLGVLLFGAVALLCITAS